MTNETQSRKAEALALLALDNLTPAQKERLNVLTAQQAGYEEIVMNEAEYQETAPFVAPFPKTYWKVLDFDEVSYVGVPEFYTSVDDCLLLPFGMDAPLRLNIYPTQAQAKFTTDTRGAEIWSIVKGVESKLKQITARAIHKAWWETQEGG